MRQERHRALDPDHGRHLGAQFYCAGHPLAPFVHLRLGIGIRPPTASWGTIIEDGAERVAELWWLTLFPGLAILVTVFACNALGDALRDAFDPRQLPRGTESTFTKEA